MKIEGNLCYKNAFILDEAKVKEMDCIINEYLGSPEYSAIIQSGDKITFRNIDELLSFDNYENSKIKTIIIRVGFGTFLYIDGSDYSKNIYGDYSIDNADRSEEFKRKIYTLINKGKRPKIYEFFAMGYDTNVILALSTFFTIYWWFLKDTASTIKALSLESLGIIIGIVICTILFFELIRRVYLRFKCLFPRVVFYIGEEIKNEDRRDKLRNNLFWCLFVGLCMTIIGGLFF